MCCSARRRRYHLITCSPPPQQTRTTMSPMNSAAAAMFSRVFPPCFFSKSAYIQRTATYRHRRRRCCMLLCQSGTFCHKLQSISHPRSRATMREPSECAPLALHCVTGACPCRMCCRLRSSHLSCFVYANPPHPSSRSIPSLELRSSSITLQSTRRLLHLLQSMLSRRTR